MESTTTATTTYPNTSSDVQFTDGDILVSLLLTIIILFNIFAGIHNSIVGVKIKKQQYD